MELLFYIFIKPFVMVFEIAFSVFGRIWDTVPVLSMTFLCGLIIYLPMYIGSKLYQRMEFTTENEKIPLWKKRCGIIRMISGMIIPIFSQIFICFSVLIFVRENSYLKGIQLWLIRDLSSPDLIIAHTVNLLPALYLLLSVLLLFIRKENVFVNIISLAEYIILSAVMYAMPSAVCYFWILFCICRIITDIMMYIWGKIRQKKKETIVAEKTDNIKQGKPDYLVYFAGLMFLILFAGFFIPTNIIKISTQEFVDITDMKSPLYFILYSMAISVGLFGLYGTAYYLFFGPKVKVFLERLIWVFACIASIDYIFSGAYQGEISSALTYFDPKEFDSVHIVLSMVFSVALSVLVVVLMEKKIIIMKLIIVAELAVLLISIVANTVIISVEYRQMDYLRTEEEKPCITLGKKGKNVVVLVMDRALGPVVPFLFEEKPELKEEFDGFIYYPNTVSFGAYTNTGIPAVYGGYEYIPEKMNFRDDISLADKHDEALKVLPVLFSENNYYTTVIDPAYAGYNWIPDLTIFDAYPDIHAYLLEGKFKNQYPDDYVREEEMLKRDFFAHAFMKMIPLSWQDFLYDSGTYCDLNANQCIRTSKYTQNGYYTNFLNSYYVLKNLPAITNFEENDENHFVSFYNAAPHMECLLQEPDYIPKKNVDNRPFHPEDVFQLQAGDRVLNMYLPSQVEFYQVDMATFLMMGEWFEYLKENDCYDNTRIIIVSDHGGDIGHLDAMLENKLDLECFLPVLMVKDFDMHGFSESEECMTNADVPNLAVEGLFQNAENPFTGNKLDGHEKDKESEWHILYLEENTLRENPGNTFQPGLWYSLKGNPYNLSNWKYLGKY